MNCPWGGWTPATIQYCEEALCGWIKTPANTWSNLAYVAAGAYIWRLRPPAALKAFAPACVFLGVVSGMFHASGTFVWQVADNIGMFVPPALGAALCMRRLDCINARQVAPAAVALVCAFTALMIGFSYTPIPTPSAMGLLVLSLFGLEIAARRPGSDFRPFWTALGLLALSFGIWQLDYRGIWCDPGNHWLQGHALWHLGTACALVPLFRYYRQYE